MQQRNRLRDRIEADDAVIGAQVTSLSPALIEVYGAIGLDFAWLDLEHSGPSALDSPALERYAMAADASDIELLVRIPNAEPDIVRKALDTGVRTLLLPRIRSAETVREAVKASRFVYDGAPGERGNAGARAAAWGGAGPDYVDREDETVCIGAMIEHRNAVADLESILDVPELGFVFLGPGDLSISLGHPMEMDHPEVTETLESVREAAVAADVPIGRVANDPEVARESIEAGYQLLRIGDEASAARSVLGDRLSTIREESG